MAVVHTWKEKLAEGEAGEKIIDLVLTNSLPFSHALARTTFGDAFIDNIVGDRFQSCQVALELQKRGVDRLLISYPRWLEAEYKTDSMAAKTGNAYLEIESRVPDDEQTSAKIGWIYSCTADVLLYFIPGFKRLYLFTPETLRENITMWKDNYPMRTAQNRTYHSCGVLVPLRVLEEEAVEAIIQL